MLNYKLAWEDASLEARREVYANYLAMPDDGTEKATWEQVNSFWQGHRFYTIKYTFRVQ